MKTTLLCIIIAAANVCVQPVLAQLSQAGGYFGSFGSNEVFISIGNKDAVQVLIMDKAGRTVDFSALTSLNASDGASGVTLKGRQFSFQIRDAVARGTIAGTTFSASREPIFGAFFAKAGGYSGVFQEDNLTTHLASLTIFPSGKVVVLQSYSLGDKLGVGQLNQAGQITVPMSDGSTYFFAFNPNPALWVAASGDVLVGGRKVYSYVLFGNDNSRMSNIATRGNVTPSSPMIAGFVVTEYAKTVLIRGVGPTLSLFGVSSACPDTQISLFSGQTVIATNSDWGQNSNLSELGTATAQVGAFALGAGSRDSALLVTLEPGAYTVLVGAQGASGGEALVEVYAVN
jgi:hypothetical protein